MKASDINYYELTDEEIQDYKDQLQIKNLNDDVTESEIRNNVKKDLNFAYDHFTFHARDLFINKAYTTIKTMFTDKSIKLKRFRFRFENRHGFNNSEELMIHTILIHNPEFLLMLHEQYHTVDRVLYAYKKIGMHNVEIHYKNFQINENILKDAYFQKQLNKLKMIAP
ncbi:hypothetical protein J7J47_03710 [Halomonas sp. ISL-60]|uniref:hypothetical protein n=1 Tax=Halomonas sp. ISL-56 TaxID=2819149 RepID=UPI001BE8A8D8|nr:hypothetical protein [Halomonas sp. ISL-56]MBT2771336.1 hypothetical protein [Halomonas sp. ISL-60]MBT2800693.1 hypothetical protein [Halomonas sp. ISL-56]